jgi:hypothetical protein
MTVGPSHVAFLLLPHTEFRNGSKNADTLAGNGLEKDVQMHLVRVDFTIVPQGILWGHDLVS